MNWRGKAQQLPKQTIQFNTGRPGELRKCRIERRAPGRREAPTWVIHSTFLAPHTGVFKSPPLYPLPYQEQFLEVPVGKTTVNHPESFCPVPLGTPRARQPPDTRPDAAARSHQQPVRDLGCLPLGVRDGFLPASNFLTPTKNQPLLFQLRFIQTLSEATSC